MRILVLDGHSPAALAVIRSLARRGLKVDVAAEAGTFFLARFSRYPKRKLIYPSPADDLSGFRDFCLDLISRREYGLILPVTDRTLVPLHYFRSKLGNSSVVALPSADALEVTLDKRRTLDLAAKLGVPVPKTFYPESAEDLRKICRSPGDAARDCGPLRTDLPVVIKSRRSKFIKGGALVSDDGPLFANSAEELARAWKEKDGQIPRPLVQEYISGEGYGIFGLMRRGEPLALFAHHRLREEEPTGARSSYCESIALHPGMVESALGLLKALEWNGPAMVEFKQDRRDSIPRLMEINGRFWGSLPLAIAAGVDFPFLYYRMLTPDPTLPPLVAQDFSKILSGAEGSPAQANYQISLRARYLYADIQHLLNILHGTPYDWMDYPGRWRSIRDFITAFFAADKYFNLDRRDPLPGIIENARFFSRIIAL